jgi:hypothetical protein
MDIKAAFNKLKERRNVPLHFFFCEQGEDGKPVLLIDNKRIPDGEWRPILAKAKKKGKCTGSLEINDDNELVVGPQGTAPTSLAKGIQIVAREHSAMVFNGITIKEAKPEEEQTPGTEPPVTDGGAKKGSNVAFTQSRLLWDATRKKVQSELQTVEQAILQACKKHNENPNKEYEIDLSELATKTKGLYEILDKLDHRLIDKLDEALNAAEPAKRDALHKEAEGLVKEYMLFVASDPRMAIIDKNGFTSSTIRHEVSEALKLLATRL